MGPLHEDVGMTVWSALGVSLGPRRDNGIVGDRSGLGAEDLGPPYDNVGMAMGPDLVISLRSRRASSIIGDRSGVDAVDLGPPRNDVVTMTMWSALGISLVPRRKINRDEHWIGLYCRFIIYGGSGGDQW